MGCSQSKIENEEAVSRCKDRKLFMKEAVSARNAFAAAHSSYATYLKNTGAALSDYAHGEVSHHHHHHSHSAPSLSVASPPHPPPPLTVPSSSASPAFAPPPPPDIIDAQPLQRAASMPQIKIQKTEQVKQVGPTIIEEEEGSESESDDPRTRLKRRSSGSNRNRNRVVDNEGDPPVPPPPMEVEETTGPVPMPPQQHDTPYDFFFGGVENVHPTGLGEPAPPPPVVAEEAKVKSEEVERKAFEEKPKRVEETDFGVGSGGGGGVGSIEKVEVAMDKAPESVGKSLRRGKQVSGAEGKRVVKVGGTNLLQICVLIDDQFLKASESAHEVSKMLEATRLHYHSNFADNRGHIDHSARVMRVITWNRSFRGLPNVDDGKDDFDSEEHETHATVLDKLLAWEKKLYDEVKAGELMKFEYQKKVASLNRHKKRGNNSEALEKAKAAVSHLHTRYIVDMQSLDSTVSEINRLRDEQLYPKLVQLVDGMATMWDTMRSHHESQLDLLKNLKYLDINQSPKETSEHHHERTYQLLVVVREWQSQFQKLVGHQKEYIKALNSWLRLNLIPIESSLREKVSSPPRIQSPPIQRLLNAWHEHLDKLQDEFARAAISNFAAVIETIFHQQEEELKLKHKCEDTRKELDRKSRQFEDWYHKYSQKRGDELEQDGTEDKPQNDLIAEKQFAIDVLKKRLEEEEEAYERLCIQVREKTITSLKTRFPDLFGALSEFARSLSHMYRSLQSVTRSHPRN
ncbi:protein ROLLING AND ERECT LEAF 2 [Quercus suber]